MAKPRKSLPAGSRGRRIHGLSWVAALSPLAAMLSGAQSPASQLDNYVAARRVQSVSGTAAVSFSGVAFHPGTHTLYVVDNDNAVIYELDTNGVLLRSLATGGFQDPEGIAW